MPPCAGAKCTVIVIGYDDDGVLRTRDKVTVRLTGAAGELVMTVPPEAVFDVDGVDHVFVVEEDEALLCEVVTGDTIEGRTEIIDGLNMMDIVLVSFPKNLEDGQLVDVSMVGEEEAEYWDGE